MLRTLNILAEQTENTMLAKTIALLRDDVERGSSLSASMSKHPKVFSNLYVAMVRAGGDMTIAAFKAAVRVFITKVFGSCFGWPAVAWQPMQLSAVKKKPCCLFRLGLPPTAGFSLMNSERPAGRSVRVAARVASSRQLTAYRRAAARYSGRNSAAAGGATRLRTKPFA